VSYAKLLDQVDAAAIDGFGFHGRFFRPGDSYPESEVVGAGRNPVLLEHTETGTDRGARRIWESLYILWRYDAEKGIWIEIARAQGTSWDWAVSLKEPARIALGRASWTVAPKVADVCARIEGLLNRELAGLEPAQRGQVMALLHDRFAARMVERGAA
jgi:hypothetical protein